MSVSKLHRGNDLSIGKGWALALMTWGGIVFLFIPIFVLIAYSFNESRFVSHWSRFSLRWYGVMWNDRSLWLALKNSLLIALVSTGVSTVLGTMAALVLGKYMFRGKRLFENLLYVPIIIPEIILGIALLTFFVMIRLPLGLLSIICAHITFSLSFVTLVVLAKVSQFDRSLEEASLDLGANRWQTFYKVVLPSISPGIFSGALLAFTLSLDDFVITFFTAGVGSTTLPLKIYSMIKFGITPQINAVSTVLILMTVLVVLIVALVQRSEKRLRQIVRPAARFLFRLVRNPALPLLGVALLLGSCGGSNTNTLNVLNWADYIDESILKEFEREYGIRVRYDNFSDNEELLAKLKIGAAGYDLIFPSDYMVKILIDEGLLATINLENIPNLVHVDERFRHLPFDPSGEYSIAYAYGFSGIGYDTRVVEEEVDSWEILWNPDYAGRISLLDDMREVFAIAFRRLGYPINEVTPERIEEALQLLMEQKKVLRKYETTMVKDLLINGEVYLAHIWSGDLAAVAEEYPHFEFCVPEEGTIMFVDNFCIPRNAPNQENAEKFINYILQPEITARIINKIYYAMPNPDAMEFVDEEIREDESIFPPDEVLDKCEVLEDLGEAADLMDRAWTRLKSL